MKIIRFTTVDNLREEICNNLLEQFIAVRLDDRHIIFDSNYQQRMEEVAADSDASITYCHYREKNGDSVALHPVIDYQFGSVRNDFDFGSVVVLNAADVLTASEFFSPEDSNSPDGGWYALRLRMSIGNTIAAVPEYLYTVEKIDFRKSGEKQHDYVDPRNSYYQAHMERVFTEFLNDIDGLLPVTRSRVNLRKGTFPVEASVIIPVRNRVSTIKDAVESALAQTPDFSFNIIVVDNGSTDGTRELLNSIEDPRLVVIPVNDSEFLGIGGCWNKAILSEHCGRFAIQLDSDDVYSSPDTLSRIVDKFYSDRCAMVIGSYMMTDGNLNPIPPGLIDHREWTDMNGANNALRINGFGAPRAFFTPVIRSILFPNVSYGEDYAVALRISREYAIGRIYDPLYYCRRWSGNSDADLSIEKVNTHNEYKDFIRSVELIARVRANVRNQEEE
ncbi:MAG: glycosyltransferase family 2 protein [Bacteroides sp.]|nr:glycosyltransferase family 2 protein [Bacteroides sp.]